MITELAPPLNASAVASRTLGPTCAFAVPVAISAFLLFGASLPHSDCALPGPVGGTPSSEAALQVGNWLPPNVRPLLRSTSTFVGFGGTGSGVAGSSTSG